MDLNDERVLPATESVCPECLARIPARRMARDGDVYLHKTCPDHGDFRAVLWRGEPAYSSWVQPKIPTYPENPFTPVERGCPFDCGLCPDHRQQPCCVLLEVTQRCDLVCPVCFAGAGHPDSKDPGIDVIETWYHRLLDAGGPFNVQLSGGEPCVRDDLPDIVALGRGLGFPFFQINTNGLRLARDPAYVKALKQAGVSTIFLQFDGTKDEIHETLRGARLLVQKQQAIERCAEHGLGIVLVPTLVPGINTDDIGALIEFGLARLPAVRGIHFQPVSYFGRYPASPRDVDRITVPEVIRAIERQSGGRLKQGNFKPSGGANAYCSFHGNFLSMPDGSLIPLTRHDTASSCCCPLEQAAVGSAKARKFVARSWSAPQAGPAIFRGGPGLGDWDLVLERAQTHLFCVSGMAFQDAWTLDLDRLRDCYLLILSPDGRLVPFCAYNLTSRQGRALYRKLDPVIPAHAGIHPVAGGTVS